MYLSVSTVVRRTDHLDRRNRSAEEFLPFQRLLLPLGRAQPHIFRTSENRGEVGWAVRTNFARILPGVGWDANEFGPC